MPIYTNAEGQKIWWGKGFTLGGIIAGAAITAVGGGVLGSYLTDLVERYKENHISIREAQGLLVYSGLSLYAMYVGIEAVPRKWKELQRMRQFELQQRRELQGNDYPYFYPE